MVESDTPKTCLAIQPITDQGKCYGGPISLMLGAMINNKRVGIWDPKKNFTLLVSSQKNSAYLQSLDHKIGDPNFQQPSHVSVQSTLKRWQRSWYHGPKRSNGAACVGNVSPRWDVKSKLVCIIVKSCIFGASVHES